MWVFQKEAVSSFFKLLIVITDFMSNSYFILAEKLLNLHNAIVRSISYVRAFSVNLRSRFNISDLRAELCLV